jgi:DNA-binding CsgD family transcriptional regulator/tetratricopeptide (TPR) repeat protein
LIGRDRELAELRRALRDEDVRGIVISGPAGVGKSRLALTTLDEAAHDGWATAIVRASAGLAALPFGSLRIAVELDGVGADEAALASGIEAALRASAAGRPMLVMIDDAHLLDEASAGLVHSMVASGWAFVLATLRSGEPRPAALTAIWKDGFAERVELGVLDASQTAELVRAVLPGEVEDTAVERLWQISEGNALYLREVMLASQDSRALREVDGRWQWRGRWSAGGRLREVVAERLGGLDPDELATIEALAVGGALTYDVLAGLTSGDAVARLEARGLIRIDPSGVNDEIAIAHPVHAKVVRDEMPSLAARAVRHNLAEALSRNGTLRESDRIRLACWSLEDGHEVDPMTLSLAADAALWHIGHAIADRLGEILPNTPATRAAPPLSGSTAGLAVRLARAAWEGGGGIAAGAALATTLAWTGATDEAERVLAQLQEKAPPGDDQLRIALALARVRFWGQQRPDDAIAELDAADAGSGPDDDPRLREEVLIDHAGIELNVGRPARALELTQRAARQRGIQLHESAGAPCAAASLALLGRSADALELIDLALPESSAPGWSELAVPQLLLARVGALARMGDLDEATQLAEACRDIALGSESLDGAAIYGVSAGEVLLRQGRPASAARRFRDAAGLLAEVDVLRYRSWALSGLARARVMLGDELGGAQALADAEALAMMPRYFDCGLHLARATLAELQGRHGDALDACRVGSEWARTGGLLVDRALVLDAQRQIQADDGVAEELEELVPRTQSPLVRALARRARASAERDPDALLESSDQLAGLSARLAAADAAAEAAGHWRDLGRTRASRAAARRAIELATSCEGARTPAIDRLGAPAILTRRELEVAQLAAAGVSSRAIAERLALSVRTVESHLYRTYTKLGVTDRAGLADALGSRLDS